MSLSVPSVLVLDLLLVSPLIVVVSLVAGSSMEKKEESGSAGCPTPGPSSSSGSSSDGTSPGQTRKRPLDGGEDTPVAAEEGAAETVTMLDVLQDEAELEEDAKAVLGGADEKNCTYLGGGYMGRQPLYSCLTCVPPPSPPNVLSGGNGRGGGGVCLACSYQCHEGHELVELYTKRNFR